ncbi:MAG: hypothetical protein ACR2FE_08855 [Aeromicrobium sp.]
MSDDDPLRDLLDRLALDAKTVGDIYEAADSADRNKAKLVEYRCIEGCDLLVCWKSPMGTLVRVRNYTLSAPLARDAVASDHNRFDEKGRGHLDARHFVLERMLEWGDGAHQDVNCKHLYDVPLQFSFIGQDAAVAKPGKPTRRIIGKYGPIDTR